MSPIRPSRPAPLIILLAAAPLSLLVACGGGDSTADDDDEIDAGDTAEVTYYQHVKPILDAKCVNCHSADGIGPFELDDFDEARTYGPEASLAVELGIMPPWPPDADCNEYKADRSLTAEQKATIAAWVEGGMVEGDAASPGAPLDVEDTGLSRVDVRLEMPAAYMPAANADTPDDYRCFVIPWEGETEQYVTGFRADPGNAKIVHHVIAFYASPAQLAEYQQLDTDEAGDGYTCFGGPGGSSRGVWLGGWAPGTLGTDFPDGTGLLVEPGSAVILQVHYNINNVLDTGVDPDLTAVEFRIDDSVEQVAMIMPWANPNWLNGTGMTIPAGDDDVTHAFQFDPTPFLTENRGFTIYSPGLHMHQLGRSATASIVRAAGGSECLLGIEQWNFHWQGSYGLREPVHFAPGDQLRVECNWDNSAQNQPFVGGEQQAPRDVHWGEGTTDEMCLATFYVAVDAP